MKKMHQKVSKFGDTIPLPHHLIVDHILPRLPVKTLIRFKSVSKSWLSIISSPNFAKSHFNLYLPSPNQCLLITASNKLIQLSYDELNNLKSPVQLNFNLDSCVESSLFVRFAGYSNGLLCLYSSPLPKGFFLVCNPALHQFRKIESPYFETVSPEIIWFGYVPSVDDYKIVTSFVCVNDDDGDDHVRQFYVYSLSIGKWKRTYEFDIGNPVDDNLSDQTTVINDVLYWSPDRLNLLFRPKRIVGFDLVNEVVKEFPWMDWLNGYSGAVFFTMNGCLSLLLHCRLRHRVWDIWTLKQHDDWSSWVKVYSVYLDAVRPVSIIPSGKLLLRDFGTRQQGFSQPELPELYEWSIIELSKGGQKRPLGDSYISDVKVIGIVGYFVESFISPFGTHNSAEEENCQV